MHADYISLIFLPGFRLSYSFSLLQDQAKELFGEFNAVRPYLRIVKAAQVK